MAIEYRTWSEPKPLKDARKFLLAALRKQKKNRKRRGARGASNRKAKKLRREIYARDMARCVYCGKDLTLETITLDHVIPYSKGGPTTARNLVAACGPCNVAKGSIMPDLTRGSMFARKQVECPT